MQLDKIWIVQGLQLSDSRAGVVNVAICSYRKEPLHWEVGNYELSLKSRNMIPNIETDSHYVKINDFCLGQQALTVSYLEMIVYPF